MTPRRRYQNYGTLSELNVTPLLDLAFVLLIIFIVTMPLLGKKADLVLPSTTATRDALNPAEVHLLSINAARETFWNGEPVDRSELAARIAEAARGEGGRSGVVIEADRSLSVQDAVEFLDLISAGGLNRAALVVNPGETPP